jgi:hypothetical protein
MLGTLIAMHLLAGYKSEVRAIVKLRNIVQRLNASIQVESDNTFGLEWEKLKQEKQKYNACHCAGNRI